MMARSRDPRPVDRLLGWLAALCGVLVTLAATRRIVHQTPEFEVWWSVLAFGAALAIVALAIGGRWFPFRLLRVLWGTMICATFLAQGGIFLAYTGTGSDELRPWIWVLEPVAMCLMVLLAPTAVAIGYALCSPFVPLISALLFLGEAPKTLVEQTPLHLGNIAIVVIVIGLRGRLLKLEQAEGEARELAERRARAEAVAAKQHEVARLVHDDVLSSLTAAIRLPGESQPEVQAAASAALQAIRSVIHSEMHTPGAGRAEVEVVDARRIFRSVAAGLRVDTADLVVGSGTIPAVVTEQVAQALGEALRNSLAHAPGATVRVLSGEIDQATLRLSIVDDGPGFDLEAITEERMGVRVSILGRMSDLPGGHAELHTGPHGTRIDLEWRR